MFSYNENEFNRDFYLSPYSNFLNYSNQINIIDPNPLLRSANFYPTQKNIFFPKYTQINNNNFYSPRITKIYTNDILEKKPNSKKNLVNKSFNYMVEQNSLEKILEKQPKDNLKYSTNKNFQKKNKNKASLTEKKPKDTIKIVKIDYVNSKNKYIDKNKQYYQTEKNNYKNKKVINFPFDNEKVKIKTKLNFSNTKVPLDNNKNNSSYKYNEKGPEDRVSLNLNLQENVNENMKSKILTKSVRTTGRQLKKKNILSSSVVLKMNAFKNNKNYENSINSFKTRLNDKNKNKNKNESSNNIKKEENKNKNKINKL